MILYRPLIYKTVKNVFEHFTVHFFRYLYDIDVHLWKHCFHWTSSGLTLCEYSVLTEQRYQTLMTYIKCRAQNMQNKCQTNIYFLHHGTHLNDGHI